MTNVDWKPFSTAPRDRRILVWYAPMRLSGQSPFPPRAIFVQWHEFFQGSWEGDGYDNEVDSEDAERDFKAWAEIPTGPGA